MNISPVRRSGVVALGLGLLLLTACGGGESTTLAEATPIAAGTDISFEEFLTAAPDASPSASPSASPAVTAASRRAPSAGSPARPQAQAATPAPTAAAGRVACPSGKVTATLEEFDVSDSGKAPDAEGRREWVIHASGSVTNQTSRPVTAPRIELTVYADNAGSDTETTTVNGTIGPGSSAMWRAVFDFDSHDEPKQRDARIAVGGWSWGDDRYQHCGTTRWSG